MKKNAFKLIEFLIVVAIISLFVVMLLPPITQARGLAKKIISPKDMKGMSVSSGGADIIRPRVNIPVIRTPGESFNILCDNLNNADGLKVSLVGGKKSIPLRVKSVKFQKIIYDEKTGASHDCDIEVAVPGNVKKGLYDIQILSDKGVSKNVRSVKIVPSYKKNFMFIQVTDTHIGVQDYQKYNPRLKNILKAVKAKKPEFIVITGDCIHEACPRGKEASAAELWAEFLDYFKELNIPIYVVPGNHDFRDRDNRRREYNKYMGPRYFSFDYGKNHFLGLDNAIFISRERPVPSDYTQQLKWADRNLAAHASSKLKVILQHVPYTVGKVIDRERLLGVVQMPAEFLKLCNKYSVDLLLDGHTHRNNERKFGKTPTLHLTTGTSSSNYDPTGIGKGWYRVIEIKNGRIKSTLGQR